MAQPSPTNIRLTSEEEVRVETVRLLLVRKLGGMNVTKSHAIHALIAKGYEALSVELEGKK